MPTVALRPRMCVSGGVVKGRRHILVLTNGQLKLYSIQPHPLQAPREMLVCILDCMAHVLTIPEEVEAAFLERTIKAFTKVKH